MRIITILLCMAVGTVSAAEYVSKVWSPDNGNGTYKNPVIDADYSDPDVCRVGSDYYLTASSFNCVPALPILHSKDLVNWKIVNYAIPQMTNGLLNFDKPQHGMAVWAPAIRYHNGEYYIFWGDPDAGIFYVKTKDPLGKWSAPVLVKAGKGLIDSSPLWDDDGTMYIVHGFAGSREGMKSVLAVCEVENDKAGESRIIFDGHKEHPTMEGPKFFKRDGYYYIFTPAGGVPTGWQTVLRSKNVYGPYEDKIVMAQGSTAINGPHQGAWVDTPDGKEDWFLHFQDKGAYGRVVHLNPMKWVNGWPVIGVDKEGKGCGEPVVQYKKPNVGATYPVVNPVESDDFNSREIGLQWQWHGNPKPTWYYTASEKSALRLYSVAEPEDFVSLWSVPNLLMQKTPTDKFTATIKFTFNPLADKKGERAGLVVMGRDYAALTLENSKEGGRIVLVTCPNADKGSHEVVDASAAAADLTKTFWFRVKVAEGGICNFSYSTDGKKFSAIGKPFKAREGVWIGAKVGMFITRPFTNNDSGWIDVDSFTID